MNTAKQLKAQNATIGAILRAGGFHYRTEGNPASPQEYFEFHDGSRLTFNHTLNRITAELAQVIAPANGGLALKVANEAYQGEGYTRPRSHDLYTIGHRYYSSNDGQSALSFSPTDRWQFPDGSRLEVQANLCRVL